jgi:dCMP deaminase
VNLPTDEGESAVLEFWILNPRKFAHHPSMSAERLSIPRYAMALAHVASLRSEDPYRKVGAAALDHDNRVIGTAYNGLAPGFNPPSEFWDDREARQKFMLHAEVNLCSLFRRGEAKLVATTTMPCTACMQTLCAYGIREIYYRDIYHASDAPEIAKLYGVRLERVADFPELSHSGE